MAIYRFVVRFNRTDDPRSMGLLADARALGFEQLKLITCQDIYFIEGQLSANECQRLALELLTDPVTQTAQWDELPAAVPDLEPDTVMIEVALRHGVTDPVADEILRAAHELGIGEVLRASTGFRYLLHFPNPKSVPLRESVTESVNPSVLLRESAPESVNKSVLLRDSVTESANPSVSLRESAPESVNPSVPLRESAPESVNPSVPLRESATESVNKFVSLRESAPESVNPSVLLRESATESVNPSVPLRESAPESVAERLLANAVIHRWTIGEIEPSFPSSVASSGEVDHINLLCNDEQLASISKERRAALDLAEMQAIRSYCERDARDLTDVEFETIAQTWSEHCGHKTFKGKITVGSGAGKNLVINSLFKTFIRAATEEINAPWVLSSFVDNAGIIDLDGENEVSFKVETHNHPSAIEPFGGANTGVGGVIRDVLGVSHKPIANTDVLCFGMQNASFDELPAGVLHPRRILSGVVAGVQDYGNKMGIPTVNGAILFDPGYAANPLVFCGTVGIAPRGRHVRSPQKGDRVILLGGRTGRDGLRGATFSSMTMDAQTGEVSGSSVQIGNPIVEKGLVDVIIPARDLGLYTAITDCGAGGLSSAVGEMSSQIGCDVDLTDVRLKYPGLAPWEIWLSEAQERMVLAVPPANLPKLQELCNTYNVELTDIGEFTGSGRLVVRYGGKPVLDLENEFLHEGIPQRQLNAVINRQPRMFSNCEHSASELDYSDTLLKLLAHPNIASKSSVVRIYDHEVQGGTVVKPLTGARNDGPSDACVLKPLGATGLAGIALANGINPEYGKLDAYHMAMSVVDEAVRNAVAVGADPERIAILDNFCWGDPLRPETLGSLVEAARGCRDAALLFRTPLISGKDSLNNEYLGTDGQRHAIPPTLLISSIGVMQDVTLALTMDLKAAGNLLYLVGEFQPVFGGSHFDLIGGRSPSENVPSVSPASPAVYKAFHQAVRGKLIRSAHDLSEGGLAVATAEMCIGGRLGLELDLDNDDPRRALFGETNGCLLVEVEPENTAAFEMLFAELPFAKLGAVTGQPTLNVLVRNQPHITVPLPSLISAWNTPIQ